MALLSMVGMSLVPTDAPTTQTTQALGARLPGLPFIQPLLANGGRISRVTGDWLYYIGWYIQANGNTANRVEGMLHPLLTMAPTLTVNDAVIGGFRFKAPNAGNGGIFGLCNNSASVAPYQQLQVLKFTDFTFVANQEYYFEYSIDLAGGLINRWIDGVALSSVAIPAWVNTAIGAGQETYLVYGNPVLVNLANNVLHELYFRDIYVLRRDAEHPNRLGPQTITALPVKTRDTNAAWTSSDGSDPLAVYNTAITTVASISTPLVTSDAGETADSLTFDPAAVTGLINGVAFVTSGQRPGGTDGQIRGTLVEDTTEAPFSIQALDTTFKSFIRLGISSKSPKGTPWSKSLLGGVKLKVQAVPTP